MGAVQSKHGDDDSSREATMTTLAARGVYDPELQLTSNQVMAMKQLFSDCGSMGESLQSMVVSDIIIDLLVKDVLDIETGEKPSVDDETLELLKNPKVVELIGQAASLGSHWQQGLSESIALPGDAWPEYMTPPATYAEPLKKPEVVEYLKGLIHANPEFNFSSQIDRFNSITGQELEEAHRSSDG